MSAAYFSGSFERPPFSSVAPKGEELLVVDMLAARVSDSGLIGKSNTKQSGHKQVVFPIPLWQVIKEIDVAKRKEKPKTQGKAEAYNFFYFFEARMLSGASRIVALLGRRRKGPY